MLLSPLVAALDRLIQRALPGAGGAASAARGVLYEMLTPAMDHLLLNTVAV